MMPSSLCSATEAATTTPWRSFCAALAEVAKVTGDSEAIAALGELLGRLPEPAPVERITVTADLEVLFHGGTSPLEELRALLDGRVIYDPDGLPVGKLSDVSVTETPTHTSERVSSALNRATDDILEAFEAPATGLHDGLNLLVNAAMSYLNGEAGDLEEVVAANWDAETTLSRRDAPAECHPALPVLEPAGQAHLGVDRNPFLARAAGGPASRSTCGERDRLAQRRHGPASPQLRILAQPGTGTPDFACQTARRPSWTPLKRARPCSRLPRR